MDYPPPSSDHSPHVPQPRHLGALGPLLRAYFHSGWAFLIPYLLAYLLYAWLGWPVNPSSSRQASSFVPCLLHVYWGLHAANLGCALVALRSWWLERQAHSTNSPTSAIQTALLFWIFLAGLFWIPGIYLEWPSDPWEHLRRINEWHILDQVSSHSTWKKSSYFLPYSLTGHTTGLAQISWLNAYYAGVCILLCWQYYRLALAAGLKPRPAQVFVLLQALLFGNNIFSFYRYYGLSSSIFAQLGAVALTRIILQAAQYSRPWLKISSFCLFRAQDDHPTGYRQNFSTFSISIPSFFPLLLSCLLLIVFTAFNHLQGIGISALGIAAIIVWRLAQLHRLVLVGLALILAATSIAMLQWYPRHPALDQIYRPLNWLTAWYGFNLFSIESPAFERALQILGAIGVLNFFAGLWLIIRKNSIIGWLTIMPVVALLLPCIAIPLVNALGAHNQDYTGIITYHRLFFAVPCTLALVALISQFRPRPVTEHSARAPFFEKVYQLLKISLPEILLCSTILISSGYPGFNRSWHSLHITPDDLSLRHHVASWTPENLSRDADENTLTIVHPLAVKIRDVFRGAKPQEWDRTVHAPPATDRLEQQFDWLTLLTPSDWLPAEESRDLSWRAFSRSPQSDPLPLRRLSLTAKATPWLRLGGHESESEYAEGHLTLRNASGRASHVFSPDLLPVDRAKRYRLTSAIRQQGDSTAINYLAVAWYDRDGKLLHSNIAAPKGAGSPSGWSNGTYSYYGLIGRPAPAEWATYSVSFGLGLTTSIPANAAFLRAGALLNYGYSPSAEVDFTGVVLQETPAYTSLLIVAVEGSTLTSCFSTSARLSRHWPAHRVHLEHAGETDLAHFDPATR